MIGAQILLGQNQEPFLEAAIRSVGWVDYFVVVRTSNTIQAEENQSKVESIFAELDKEWRLTSIRPDEKGHFSFAEARNKGLEEVPEDDYVFILDADDVHYPEWEQEVKEAIVQGATNITAYFYHMMVYKDLYQYVQPREIIYQKFKDTTWVQGVHEQLITKRPWPVVSDYHYMHYGYIKPQKQVYARWKFYSELEGDHTHYDGQDPDNILTDRITVSKRYSGQHPPAVKGLLKSYPSCPLEILESRETMPVEKVGLILITYNDQANIAGMLESLSRTHKYPNFTVLAIDLDSTDGTLAHLQNYSFIEEIVQTEGYASLVECLNYGLNHFRVRHDIHYIGWIHPDHRFDAAGWLTMLWKDLQEYPMIGKICAWNTRVGLPSSHNPTPGHEQCYIIRKDIVNKVGLFDTKFEGIGGYEDWDYNYRVLNHNDYKVMMSGRSLVYHEGMATRAKRDTTSEQIHNAEYYYKKYGTYDPAV